MKTDLTQRRKERRYRKEEFHAKSTPQTSADIGTEVLFPPGALNILRHSIGYDDAGNDRWHGATDDCRRNSFVTGPGSTDWPNCLWLVENGWMVDHGANRLCGGDHCFSVTTAGKELVRLQRPPPPSRGKRRYQDFLNADSGLTFIEWLKRRSKNNPWPYGPIRG